jgi:hypothetical protein
MRLYTALFALSTFAAVTGSSASAQNTYGTASDNYTQSQAAPI